MKKSIVVGISMAIVCVGLFGVLMAEGTSPQPGPQPQKWEYKSVDFGFSPDFEDKRTLFDKDSLSKLGRDGWELVAVQSYESKGTTVELSYYFKRPLAQ
jgi:hypothetical protein